MKHENIAMNGNFNSTGRSSYNINISYYPYFKPYLSINKKAPQSLGGLD
jgi:hypothetical protein